MTMSSSRPYLIRALYEWILDNGSTPYILVDAVAQSVKVPEEHIKDGKIILNIAPSAVRELVIGNLSLEFNGRFAGVSKQIYVPIESVLGIYARENGQGMFFDTENPLPEPPHEGSSKSDQKKIGRPALRVVK
jgi:stringent starvation protein B